VIQKRVKVKPNSKSQNIKEEADGSLIVHLKSPPVDGKANDELIKLLAKQFDVPKSNIRIKSGLSSRQKLIEVDIDS
jgi:hypothetical protein